MDTKEKIEPVKFKDLSAWLKAAIVSAWIIAGSTALALIYDIAGNPLY